MIIINGINLSEYQISRLPIQIEFSQYPGSIIYSSISEINLRNPPTDYLNPIYQYSPLYPLFGNYRLKIEMLDDEYNELKLNGFITNAIISQAGEIKLFVEDQFQKLLEKTQVLADYEEKTPIEIAKLIIESYGVEIDLNRYGLIKYWQEQEGLIYDFKVNIADQIKFIDSINELCKAGFMRATIFLNKVYFIGIEIVDSYLEIYPQEIHNVPMQNQQVMEYYGGGSIKWLAGEQKKIADYSKGLSEINLDYSGSGSLILINGNGAESLLELYSNQSVIGRYYDIDIDSRIISKLKPGEMVQFLPPILHKTKSVYAQFIARKSNEQTPYTLNCVFEVKKYG